MPVCQLGAFHIIFCILWFSIEIENLPMTRSWSIFRALIYPIMNVCLSISDHICSKIKLLYFWVNLGARPTCVTVANLYRTPIWYDITTNHAYGHIAVFRNPPQAWFYWDSQLVLEVYDITPSSKWVTIKLCLSHMTILWFLNDFQDDIFHEASIIFRTHNW